MDPFRLAAPLIGKSFPISLSVLLVLAGYCAGNTQRYRQSNKESATHPIIFLATLCRASILGFFAAAFDATAFYPQIISIFTLALLTTLPTLMATCSLLVGARLSRLHSATFDFPLLQNASRYHLFPSATVAISTQAADISPIDGIITALGIIALIVLIELAKVPSEPASSTASEKELSSAPQICEQLANALRSSGLSRRESEVLAMRAVGSSYDAIASELGISSSTARTYLYRALKKIGCSSVSEVAREFLPGLDKTTSQPLSAPNKVGDTAAQGSLHARLSAVMSLAAGIYMAVGSIANEQKLAIILASMGQKSANASCCSFTRWRQLLSLYPSGPALSPC